MTEPERVFDAVDYLLSIRRHAPSVPLPAYVPQQRKGGGSSTSDVVHISDPVAYVKAALARVAQELAETTSGGRNHALNAAAFRLGGIIGAGLPLNVDDVEAELLHACDLNGYNGEHGDALATIRRGLADGEGRASFEWEQTAPVDKPAPFVALGTAALGTALNENAEHTSWWPRELAAVIDGEEDELPPAFLARDDGRCLFYAGKVNALIGESESGKTWVALLAVAQQLQARRTVLFVDFEDTAAGVVSRLRALGVSDEQLGQLVYISPDENLHQQAAAEFQTTLQRARPVLVVVDGVNAAMTLLGLDLQSNTDATRFSLDVLRPLKRTGAAVVTIDHVTKSKDGRGAYAIGAQAKRADIDGCSLIVEVVDPFGRGMTGRLKLTVSKDRPGHVRAISLGAKIAGWAVLVSAADGTVEGRVERNEGGSDGARVARTVDLVKERICAQLVQGVATRSQLERTVTGKTDAIRDAVAELLVSGHVERVGTTQQLRLVRAFSAHEPAPPFEGGGGAWGD